ncbi:MAG: hypothetical protein AAGK78_01905, partial [Planctomycetota bacterium]
MFCSRFAFGEEPGEPYRIYWVGHSLVSGEDAFEPGGGMNVMEAVAALAKSQGRTVEWHKHTTP